MILPRRLLAFAIGICCGALVCSAQYSADGFQLGLKVGNDSWEVTGQSKTLSAIAPASLIKALASSSRDKSEHALQEIAAQTRIKTVDLSGKGEEFLAQAFGAVLRCSPTGNCESWVLRQDGGVYSVILRRRAAQTFTIQSTVTNGFHDIVLGMHGSAFMQELTVYRFDGTAYRRAACYEENFLGKNGDTLDEPRITACAKKSRK